MSALKTSSKRISKNLTHILQDNINWLDAFLKYLILQSSFCWQSSKENILFEKLWSLCCILAISLWTGLTFLYCRLIFGKFPHSISLLFELLEKGIVSGFGPVTQCISGNQFLISKINNKKSGLLTGKNSYQCPTRRPDSTRILFARKQKLWLTIANSS